MKKESKVITQKGVCKICGCTDTDPCWNPYYGYCGWADETETICTHCADDEIFNDPKTEHCINTCKEVNDDDA